MRSGLEIRIKQAELELQEVVELKRKAFSTYKSHKQDLIAKLAEVRSFIIIGLVCTI